MPSFTLICCCWPPRLTVIVTVSPGELSTVVMNESVELTAVPFTAVICRRAWIPALLAGEPCWTELTVAPPLELGLSSTPT